MPIRSDSYSAIIERVFFSHYPEQQEPEFSREELVEASEYLGIRRPKNLGDIIYTFRFRRRLPQTILDVAPSNLDWVIRLAGSGRYRFSLTKLSVVEPAKGHSIRKIPDATPGVIRMYSLSDEQALLAVVRYNRLVDIFTRVTCYPLQSHLRTQVPGLGQVETDDIYVGVDRFGAHYVIPVQAKGGSDILSTVQIEQDIKVCS